MRTRDGVDLTRPDATFRVIEAEVVPQVGDAVAHASRAVLAVWVRHLEQLASEVGSTGPSAPDSIEEPSTVDLSNQGNAC